MRSYIENWKAWRRFHAPNAKTYKMIPQVFALEMRPPYYFLFSQG